MRYYPPRYLFRRHELLRVVKPGQNFLEVGPGTMALAQDLLDYFQEGLLVDFSPQATPIYEALPLLARQRLTLCIGDFLEVPLSNKFDCVIACEVLEHVEHESPFLQRAYDNLQSGGQILLSMPARMKFWSKHDELVGHLRRYEKEPTYRLLQEHGFQNVRVISYGFPFINMLRWLRLLFAKYKWEHMAPKTAVEKTAWSGIEQTASFSRWFGLICNPYTIYPLARLASLFNQQDWSEGYLIVAHKV